MPDFGSLVGEVEPEDDFVAFELGREGRNRLPLDARFASDGMR
jgi:hypothetical protein